MCYIVWKGVSCYYSHCMWFKGQDFLSSLSRMFLDGFPAICCFLGRNVNTPSVHNFASEMHLKTSY